MSPKITTKNDGKAKIFIVDDHPIVRHGLTQLINQQVDLVVCGEGQNARETLRSLPSLKPDLIIIDISLDGMSGLELVKIINIKFPELPILIVSIHDENLYAERALRAGAKGYIMKEKATENIIKGIRKVLNGEIYLSNRFTHKMLQNVINGRKNVSTPPMKRLSDRELEIFQLIGEGYKTKQIAALLFISIKTVETHREHIKGKLGLRDSIELLQNATLWVQADR